jgi:hypothetical protein
LSSFDPRNPTTKYENTSNEVFESGTLYLSTRSKDFSINIERREEEELENAILERDEE